MIRDQYYGKYSQVKVVFKLLGKECVIIKKLLKYVLVLILVLTPTASLADQSIKIYHNMTEVKLQSDQQPFINTQGRTMIPLRALFEEIFDASVDYDFMTGAILIQGQTVGGFSLKPEKNEIYMAGSIIPIEPKVENIDGRVYLPLRMLSEIARKEVNWDGATKSIYIGEYNKPNPNKPRAFLASPEMMYEQLERR